MPQIEPLIDSHELKYLTKAIESTFVTEHKLTEEFEERLRELTGSKYAVAMCNATMGLYFCLLSLGIGEGDEVIVPNLTFIATSNAVILAGATPVFCDVVEQDFSLDLEKAEKCLSPKTKAIMPVHLYGTSCDMDSVMAFAKKQGLFVVEDAAQGVGVRYKGTHVGSIGDLGVLSFYGNKTITCGEGGVVLTNNKELRDKCYELKNFGRADKGMFIHDTIGFNFCFTEMQAAVGLSQLDKLTSIIKQKNIIRDFYNINLLGLKSFMKAIEYDSNVSPVYWFTSFLLENPDDKPQLGKFLKDNGVQTREFFYPLDLQPCYDGMYNHRCDLTTSHDLYRRGISLPSSHNLKKSDLERVIQLIHFYFGGE